MQMQILDIFKKGSDLFYTSLLLTFFIVFTLKSNTLLWFVIVLGQGHFLMSYYYTYKARKINKKYFTKFIFLLLFTGYVCFYISKNMQFYDIFVFIVSLFFTLHYFFDECKISNTIVSKEIIILYVSFIYSYSLAFLIKYFGFSIGNLSYFIVLFVYIVLYSIYILSIKKIVHIKTSFNHFYFINLFLPIISIFSTKIDIIQISSFIIIFHYIRWYLFYIQKFKIDPDETKLKTYLTDIFIINLLVFLTFLIFTKYNTHKILIYFLNPLYFYGWTMIHILLSMKISNFKYKI